MSNPFKEELSKLVSADEEQKRKEEETIIKLLSFFQKGKNLTEEDKKNFLGIDEKIFSKEMYQMIYNVVKISLETGKVPEFETYVENYYKEKGKKKVSLEQIPEKWEKSPEEWEKGENSKQGGEQYDEREI